MSHFIKQMKGKIPHVRVLWFFFKYGSLNIKTETYCFDRKRLLIRLTQLVHICNTKVVFNVPICPHFCIRIWSITLKDQKTENSKCNAQRWVSDVQKHSKWLNCSSLHGWTGQHYCGPKVFRPEKEICCSGHR